jgi:hypothetical protein
MSTRSEEFIKKCHVATFVHANEGGAVDLAKLLDDYLTEVERENNVKDAQSLVDLVAWEGVVRLQKSESDECVCCKGNHIYSCGIDFGTGKDWSTLSRMIARPDSDARDGMKVKVVATVHKQTEEKPTNSCRLYADKDMHNCDAYRFRKGSACAKCGQRIGEVEGL